MLQGKYQGFDVVARLDWVGIAVEGVGPSDYSRLWDRVKHLFGPTQGKSRCHLLCFGGEGYKVSFFPKQGVKNTFCEIELSGKWFSSHDFQDLAQALAQYGCVWRFFRVDLALDMMFPQDEKEWSVEVRSDLKKCYTGYRGIDGAWTGFKIGKGKRVLNLYDKAVQSGAIGPWWRFEMRLRGEYAHQVNGGWSDYGEEYTILELLQYVVGLEKGAIAVSKASEIAQIFLCESKKVSTVRNYDYQKALQKLKSDVKGKVRRFLEKWGKSDVIPELDNVLESIQ